MTGGPSGELRTCPARIFRGAPGTVLAPMRAWRCSRRPWPPRTRQAGVGGQRAIGQTATTVGFWAGEAVPGTDWDIPQTYWKRRDTHFYTPRLWRVLRRHRIPLYFNLRYRRDFGPVPAGKPRRTTRCASSAPPTGSACRSGAGSSSPTARATGPGRGARPSTSGRSSRSSAGPGKTGPAAGPRPRPGAAPAHALRDDRGDHGRQRWRCLRVGLPADDRPGRGSAPPGAATRTWCAGPSGAESGSRPPRCRVPSTTSAMVASRFRTLLTSSCQRRPGTSLLPGLSQRLHLLLGARPRPRHHLLLLPLRPARVRQRRPAQPRLRGPRPYRRFASLLHDVRLAATLGAREVPIYSLERTLRAYGGPRSLVRLVQAAQNPFAGPAAAKSTAPTPGRKSSAPPSAAPTGRQRPNPSRSPPTAAPRWPPTAGAAGVAASRCPRAAA